MRREASYRRKQLTGEDAGKVHLRGMDAHDHATFCGHCWTGVQYEDTLESVDCPGCLRAIAQARELLYGATPGRERGSVTAAYRRAMKK